MTKQDFLDGKSFRFLDYNVKGASTFKYDKPISSGDSGTLLQEIRNYSNDKIILTSYHLNVSKVTENSFSGFVYVVNKKVNVRYFFKDMVVIE